MHIQITNYDIGEQEETIKNCGWFQMPLLQSSSRNTEWSACRRKSCLAYIRICGPNFTSSWITIILWIHRGYLFGTKWVMLLREKQCNKWAIVLPKWCEKTCQRMLRLLWRNGTWIWCIGNVHRARRSQRPPLPKTITKLDDVPHIMNALTIDCKLT